MLWLGDSGWGGGPNGEPRSHAPASLGRGQLPALPTHIPNHAPGPLGVSPDIPHLAPPVGIMVLRGAQWYR